MKFTVNSLITILFAIHPATRNMSISFYYTKFYYTNEYLKILLAPMGVLTHSRVGDSRLLYTNKIPIPIVACLISVIRYKYQFLPFKNYKQYTNTNSAPLQSNSLNTVRRKERS
jgi:hypothetical protein